MSTPDRLSDHLDEAPAPGAPPPNGPLRFARMAGSSIAGPDAAAWVTDFLNAAYFRRAPAQRSVEDLRLAFGVLTTHWAAKPRGQRLRLGDLRAFHRAFGAERFATRESSRGTLSRAQLLAGAAELIGPWFPDAWADPARRGWGIAFETARARAAHDPSRRLELSVLGAPTPERAPLSEQVWHTYPPVELPSAAAAVAALTAPETWPDFASETGRFTPLRAGGLDGQSFEIEVAAGTDAGLPIFTRGYVTVPRVLTQADPRALAAWVAALEDGLARWGQDEPRAVPEGGQPVAGFDLVTHQGHFMGSGRNRLLVFTHEGRAWARAAGTWDPMPWHIGSAYRLAGHAAQQAFWGDGDVEAQSMLHQLARSMAP